MLSQIWYSIRREAIDGSTERDRMRQVTSDLILHLHPRTVPAAALRLTYTFGLGGLAILLLVILVGTGMLLSFAYTPSPEAAYGSIIDLETTIWFGQLIRNLHHWSANLLLIVAVLHLLRVLYTGAYRPPREFNWQLGLILLTLAILGNFTGYLLPWDQLAYWAVTVGSSLIDHWPLIGSPLHDLFLGGDTVSGTTLRNFYALHMILIPLGFLVTGAFHIWRVRKDTLSVPSGSTNERVTTIPHLVSREVIVALLAIMLLLAWATWVDAPLDGAADPNTPPDPTKTAWYFAGIQELLLHVHPTVGAAILPLLVLGGLIGLPYLAGDGDGVGIWFGSQRGRRWVLLSFLIGMGAAAAWVAADEIGPSLISLPDSIGRGVLPLIVIGISLWLYRRFLIAQHATRSEIHLAIFTLIGAAFLMLTLTGIFLRGTGMDLEVPGL